MSESIQILRVVVASPGDVAVERDIVCSVLEDLNRSIAADRRVRLEPVRWETDAYPGFHQEGPQGVIDSALRIPDADLFVCIFWKRFGTPTNDAASGTEHEIRLAYESWKQNRRPQIMVYFNQKPWTPQTTEELEQFSQILSFRKSFPKKGLWWTYKGAAQFEQQFRDHLTSYIRYILPVSPAEPHNPSQPHVQLPDQGSVTAGQSDYFSIQKTLIDENARVFIGRQDAQRALDTFLNSETRGYFLLSGHPGQGKTALLSHLVRSKGYIHHFLSVASGRAEPHLILRSLLSQIIPRVRPGATIPDTVPQLTKLWEELLAIAAQTGPIVVAIDGFDELPRHARQGAPYLPTDGLARGVYFVLTVRYGEPLTALAGLVAMVPNCVHALEPLAPGEIEQILGTRGLTLPTPLLAHIVELSQGNPLYVRAVADQLKSDPHFRIGDLPRTVEGFFRAATMEFHSSSDDNLRNVLGLLAVARKPLTLLELHEITSSNQRELYEKGIAPVRDFLIDGINGYWFYHPSFREFVISELLYTDEIRHFHSRMAEYLQRGDHPTAEYRWMSLAHHLSEAGDVARLIKAISPTFLIAKARRLGFAVLEDIELVTRAMLQLGDPASVEQCVDLVEQLRSVVSDDVIQQVTVGLNGSIQEREHSAPRRVISPNLPVTPGADVYVGISPAGEVTADFFELFRHGGGTVVAVGDAPSRGLKSSFVARFLGNLLRVVVERKEDLDLAGALAHINEQIAPFDYFERVSMQCVKLDLDEGLLYLVNAGHPDPVLYSKRYRKCDILPISGGLLHDSSGDSRQVNAYNQYWAEIGSGDILVMLTDGLLEAHRLTGDPYGYQLTKIIEAKAGLSSRVIGEAILQDFLRHTGEEDYRDDAMLVVISVRDAEIPTPSDNQSDGGA